MKAFWMKLLPAVAIVAGVGPAWAKPAQDFPFTCTFDLSQISDADSQRIGVPSNLRSNSLIATGTKKCTFSANHNTQITCTTEVQGWPNPHNVTIKDFKEPCQWFLNASQCDVNATVVATNQTFKVKRVDANTAGLELHCEGKAR